MSGKKDLRGDYLNSSSDDSDSGAATIGIRIGFGLAAYTAHKNKKDQERRERKSGKNEYLAIRQNWTCQNDSI